MKNETISAAAQAASETASAGLKGSIAGGAGMFIGGWTSNDIAMVGGLIIGVIGLMVQIHYKRREHALREKEHDMLRTEHLARMSELP